MKKLTAAIFIDDSNLFYAQKKVGWKVDLKKLKRLFEREVKILFFHYHVAIPAKEDNSYQATQKYLRKIKSLVTLIPKPLKYIKQKKGFIKKGDVDLEITLDVVRNLEKVDIILLVSGDSDYVELRKYVLEKGKQIIFLGFKENMAWEIKRGKYIFLNRIRSFIQLGEKKTPRCYPGRLLLSLLYQKQPILSRLTNMPSYDKNRLSNRTR